MASAVATGADVELAKEIAKYYADPLGFVLFAYPWGKKGTLLEQYSGPDEVQTNILKEIGEQVRSRKFDGKNPVSPIREATSSGHGIGKSTLVAWIVDWIMSTRPHAQGTVTANTFKQLETKTWAQIQKWTKLCITSHWFIVTGERMYYRTAKDSWFTAPQSSKEENSEAFAGQHAANSTSFYILDEASAIPDPIWEVAEGGLTDGEPMIFAFGNATRSSGKFHRITFGSDRDRWKHRAIDSRESAHTNKAQIQEWIDDYGEDSDFVRVRVRGLPPRASDAQFIDLDRINEAQKRPALVLPDDPLIAGADFAWGGDDNNVVRFRRGMDARSIPPIVVPGEFTRDPSVMTLKLADVLNNTYDGQKVAMLFMDSAGIAGPVDNRLRQLGHENLMVVNFGADSPDSKYANMRAYMWGQMKEWLLLGSVDKSAALESDLTGPGYTLDKKQRVLLEPKDKMKKRGLASPDHGDSLALTFAAPVAPKQKSSGERERYRGSWMG
jgi:hypothetical protein